MTEVRVACSEFLKQQLDPSNCLGIRRFADVHSCMELLDAAHSYTEQHFSEIVHGEEFLNLPAMQICELISSDQLTVPSEEKVNNTPMHYSRFHETLTTNVPNFVAKFIMRFTIQFVNYAFDWLLLLQGPIKDFVYKLACEFQYMNLRTS
jgi:hypothetical protein